MYQLSGWSCTLHVHVSLCKQVPHSVVTAAPWCRLQLVQVTESFQRNLIERLQGNDVAREQINLLCLGMQKVRIPMVDTSDVTNAITALQCLSPLQPIWANVHKKSRVQHCMCQMLCRTLQPLVEEGVIHTLCGLTAYIVFWCTRWT
jgi:hypothetical protein